jgi:acetone carboxylase gamma subunit
VESKVFCIHKKSVVLPTEDVLRSIAPAPAIFNCHWMQTVEEICLHNGARFVISPAQGSVPNDL